MDGKEIKLLKKEDDAKLKDIIFDYLEESVNDLIVTDSPEVLSVVRKYNIMLTNIKNVCVYRNKF